MAKKKKQHHHQGFYSSVDLRERIDRSVREGRFQQALELAKQLCKYEPTPEHQELLRKTYLGRARQLRTSGYYRDAATVLNVAAQLEGSPPAYLQSIAQELGLCGETKQTVILVNSLPADSPARAQLLLSAVDSALRQGPAAKATLPADLQPDFDRVLLAARQVEAGQDEAARETLQPIGLRSPFLEWKVLLRGLSAYYQHDDARALENWQRLTTERLPARLVAPYRFACDAGFRTAQPPRLHPALQQQLDRIQGPNLSRRLRDLQAALADEDSMSRAFRIADECLPLLRQQAPHLVPRLAVCFYGAMIDHGQPEDERRYTRAFGSLPDDPNFTRLRARVFEGNGNFAEAHLQWQQYERWVAAHPAVWPGDQAARVRALIWKHMGQNAASVPDLDKLPLPPFLRDHPDRPRPLKPTAEDCFRKSLELAPDQLDAHVELVQLYLADEKPKKAEKAARLLLEHHPNHVATLEKLSELRVHDQDYAEGITLLEQALRANPLDRRLRERLGTVHLFQARTYMEASRFDEARAEFRTSLAMGNDGDGAVHCKMAACEFKAGDFPQAEQYLQKALEAAADCRLGVAYNVLIEIIRLKLPGKLRTRFNKEFNAELAKPIQGQGAALIASTAAAHNAAGVTYHGQKTHENKVITYLKKAVKAQFTEAQLTNICPSLITLKAPRTLIQDYTSLGAARFPKNPNFSLWEVDSWMMSGPGQCPVHRVRPLLDRARGLIAALPPGSEKERLQELLQNREESIAAATHLSGFGGIGGFLDAFANMHGGGDWSDEDEDDDDGGW